MPGQPVPATQSSGCLKAALIVFAILAVSGIGVVACLGFGANSVMNELRKQTGRAAESDYDITEPACSFDDLLGPQAKGTITNTSKEQQAFQVTVRFTAPDGSLVSEDSDFTDPIDVGQSTDYEVTSLKDQATADTTCSLGEVSYTIFDNQNDPGGN
jgi:hypothetical protein